MPFHDSDSDSNDGFMHSAREADGEDDDSSAQREGGMLCIRSRA